MQHHSKHAMSTALSPFISEFESEESARSYGHWFRAKF
jgi:hypothetical protein